MGELKDRQIGRYAVRVRENKTKVLVTKRTYYKVCGKEGEAGE